MSTSSALSAPSGGGGGGGANDGGDNSSGDASASSGGGGGGKRRYADPEYIALSELLSTFSGEMDEQNGANANASADAHAQAQAQAQENAQTQARKRLRAGGDQELLRQFQRQQQTASSSYQRYRPRREREAATVASSTKAQMVERGADSRDPPAAGAGTPPMQREELTRDSPPHEQQGENRLKDKKDEDEALVTAEGSLDGSSAAGSARVAAPKRRRTTTTSGRGGGSVRSSTSGSSIRHTKLAELETRVRVLERDNLHLKQALLLGNHAGGGLASSANTAALASLGGLGELGSLGAGALGRASGGPSRASVQRLLAERTKVVTEMVEQLNASCLSLGDASRVWHEDCRIGVGVREWDAFGRLETISLWNMIRCVFASMAVDIVELRPHLADGEMILTKWRVQGEIASAPHLERVCASEDCPPAMRVALMAIKSSDLTFTVTTYVIFQDLRIAEQHHCWDQVGVFKRLFGGDIPASVQSMLTIDEATASGRRAPLDV